MKYVPEKEAITAAYYEAKLKEYSNGVDYWRRYKDLLLLEQKERERKYAPYNDKPAPIYSYKPYKPITSVSSDTNWWRDIPEAFDNEKLKKELREAVELLDELTDILVALSREYAPIRDDERVLDVLARADEHANGGDRMKKLADFVSKPESILKPPF